MEEKVFALINNIYTEMQQGFTHLNQEISGIKQDISGLKEDVSTLKQDVSGLKEDVSTLKQDVTGLKQDIIRMENKMDNKFGALFDGHTQQGEGLQRVENKVDQLADNYERQDVKIEVIHSRAK